jgi:hypothetical protein
MLSLVPVSNSDVQNVIKWFRPSKSVGLDGIQGSVIKSYSEFFVPVLNYIFNRNLPQNTFPKQAAIVPVFKKLKTSTVGNYRSIALLNNFSTFFKFITHYPVSHFLKFELNASPAWSHQI